MSDSTSLLDSRQQAYDSVVVLAKEDSGSDSKKGHSGNKVLGNSVMVTAGVIIGDTLGAGLLSMSAAVSMFGWLLGGLFILGMLALNLHLCMLLWRLRQEFPQARTLGQLAEATFSRSSRWQQSMVRRLTDQVQYLFIFCLLAADCTSWGKGLGMLFYDVHLCLPTWVLIGSAILLPVHVRTRALGGNKVILFVNCMAVLCSVMVPMRHFMSRGAIHTRPLGSEVMAVEPLSLLGLLNGLNIMTFNFTIQFVVVEIVSEMEKPEQFPQAMWGIAYPFLSAMFLGCGVGGYYFLGDSVRGLLINSLPFGLSLRITAACLVWYVLVAYLLKSIVFCKAVHSFYDPVNVDTDNGRSQALYTVIVAVTLAGAFLMSQIVPFFTPLIDLIGATLAPLCCMLIPIAMYVQWYRTFHNRRHLSAFHTAEWVLIAAEVALSAIIMTIGTYDSLSTILAGWRSHGAPFACHCEHIWNTCKCSARNPGMHGECPTLRRAFPGMEVDMLSPFSEPFFDAPSLIALRAGMWWY